MPSIDVDPERLGQEAGALSNHHSWLNRARGELANGCSVAAAGCGHVADGGLSGALNHLRENWQYDLDEIGKDVDAMAQVMRSLAEMYGATDHDNAEQLRG